MEHVSTDVQLEIDVVLREDDTKNKIKVDKNNNLINELKVIISNNKIYL